MQARKYEGYELGPIPLGIHNRCVILAYSAEDALTQMRGYFYMPTSSVVPVFRVLPYELDEPTARRLSEGGGVLEMKKLSEPEFEERA